MARSSLQRAESYRFIVVYTREPREIPGADDVWKGQVIRVPTGEEDMEGGHSRAAFSHLQEVPAIIRRLMAPAGDPDRKE